MNELKLIVQATGHLLPEEDSVLCEHWSFGDEFYMVAADCIQDSVFVLILSEDSIAVVHPTDSLSSKFTTMYTAVRNTEGII